MSKENNSGRFILWTISLILMMVSTYLIYNYAPLERIEGLPQKIYYVHVPSAMTMFLLFFIVFISSILYLWKREREWDIYALSAAEVGILFCSIVLITGPIWAKPIWGVWWTWDSRLTTTLILWFIYAAYLMLRSHSTEQNQRARFAAIVGIIGFLDVPLVHFSVIWWRSFHPINKMFNMNKIGSGLGDDRMKITLVISLVSFIIFSFLLMNIRVGLEKMKDEIERIRTVIDDI